MRGARWVQTNVLEANPDADVHVYAVFFEMVAGDEGAKSRLDPSSFFDDSRVTLFWDDQKIAGRWYEQNVTKLGRAEDDPDRIEWDAFFLYAPEAEWSQANPPTVVAWGRTVIGEKDRLQNGLAALLERSERASNEEESE